MIYLKKNKTLITKNIDLSLLIEELKSSKKYDTSLKISKNAWIILPYHISIDRSYYNYISSSAPLPVGTTACTRNACGGFGVQIKDLFSSEEVLRSKIITLDSLYRSFFGSSFDINLIIADLLNYKELISFFVE
ncbi:MAG: adenylosuccinate synthetase [Clostridia bacterium]|nr:adenylosuccinate synthetase [Clostridia bacterium]